MNRRTFIGSLCAVLTAPLWGKKAAIEPFELGAKVEPYPFDPERAKLMERITREFVESAQWSKKMIEADFDIRRRSYTGIIRNIEP